MKNCIYKRVSAIGRLRITDLQDRSMLKDKLSYPRKRDLGHIKHK